MAGNGGAGYAPAGVDIVEDDPEDSDSDDEPSDGLLADPFVRGIAIIFVATVMLAGLVLGWFVLAARLHLNASPLQCESSLRFRAVVGVVEWRGPLHALLELNVSYCVTPTFRAFGRCGRWQALAVPDLILSHGELAHVLLLSPDLEDFVHVHPDASIDERESHAAAHLPLRVDVRLPRAGAWAVSIDAVAAASVVSSCVEGRAAAGYASEAVDGRAGPTSMEERMREGAPFEVLTRFDVPFPPGELGGAGGAHGAGGGNSIGTSYPGGSDGAGGSGGLTLQPNARTQYGVLHSPIGVPRARALVSLARAAAATSTPVRASIDGAGCCRCAAGAGTLSRAGARAPGLEAQDAPGLAGVEGGSDGGGCYAVRLSVEAGGGGFLPISRGVRKGSCNLLRLRVSRLDGEGVPRPVRSLMPYMGAAAHLVLARLRAPGDGGQQNDDGGQGRGAGVTARLLGLWRRGGGGGGARPPPDRVSHGHVTVWDAVTLSRATVTAVGPASNGRRLSRWRRATRARRRSLAAASEGHGAAPGRGRRLHAAVIPSEAADPRLPRPAVLGAADWTCSGLAEMRMAVPPPPARARGADGGGGVNGTVAAAGEAAARWQAARFGPELQAWVDIREAGDYRLFVSVADAADSHAPMANHGDGGAHGHGGTNMVTNIVTASFWLRVRSTRDPLPAAAEPSAAQAAEQARAACAASNVSSLRRCNAGAAEPALGLCGELGRAAEVQGFCALASAAAAGAVVRPSPSDEPEAAGGSSSQAEAARADTLSLALVALCVAAPCVAACRSVCARRRGRGRRRCAGRCATGRGCCHACCWQRADCSRPSPGLELASSVSGNANANGWRGARLSESSENSTPTAMATGEAVAVGGATPQPDLGKSAMEVELVPMGMAAVTAVPGAVGVGVGVAGVAGSEKEDLGS